MQHSKILDDIRSINGLPTTEDLCMICSAIPFQFFQEQCTYIHHRTHAQLKLSASTCQLCYILFTKLESVTVPGPTLFSTGESPRFRLDPRVILVHGKNRRGDDGWPNVLVMCEDRSLGMFGDGLCADILPYHGMSYLEVRKLYIGCHG